MQHPEDLASLAVNTDLKPDEPHDQGNDGDSLEWLANDEEVQTVMIRGIPCKCSREDILEAVEELGFGQKYDFFYVPLRRGRSLGYAFIGFPASQVTKEFAKTMTGYKFSNKTSSKTITVVPASVQGLSNNMDHFRSTSVMQSAEKPLFPSPFSGESSDVVPDVPPTSLSSKPIGNIVSNGHSVKNGGRDPRHSEHQVETDDKGDAKLVYNEGIAYIKMIEHPSDKHSPYSMVRGSHLSHQTTPDTTVPESPYQRVSCPLDLEIPSENCSDTSEISPPSSSSVPTTRVQKPIGEQLGAEGLEWVGQEDVQTVMIRGIPCSCNKEDILVAIEELGFAERLDFFYVPLRRGRSLGYAFIGFPDTELTKDFARAMTGYKFSNKMSSKSITVVPASVQGLNNNLDHFMSTSVMRNTRKQPLFSIQC